MLSPRVLGRIDGLGFLRALKQPSGRADAEKNADDRADREIEHSGIQHGPNGVAHRIFLRL
jgi:hypothetical protein